MELKVTNIHLLSSNGRSTRGFADVQFIFPQEGIFFVRDFRIMEGKDGNIFVRVPFITYKDKNGEIKHLPVIDFPVSIKKRVEVLILDQYYRMKENTNGNQISR